VLIPADVARQPRPRSRDTRDLAEDWLDDVVKGFLPGPDPDAQRFYPSDSLIVDVASPRYLLAIKLFAARAEIWPSVVASMNGRTDCPSGNRPGSRMTSGGGGCTGDTANP
jgi:hypothetical protein